mgnify:CR=1 FL=1
MVKTEKISFSTEGDGDIINLTGEVAARIKSSGVNSGTVTVFTPSATSAITTIEYEPGLLQDFGHIV